MIEVSGQRSEATGMYNHGSVRIMLVLSRVEADDARLNQKEVSLDDTQEMELGRSLM